MNKLIVKIRNFSNILDVDMSGGVENITQRVTSEVKSIAPIVFGLLAIIALIFTLVKGFKALMAYRANQDYNTTPVICGAIATVIMGLLTTSAFFGWFGL